MKQPHWFRNATMMAFLAVISLFVSPVLGLNCYCHASPTAASLHHSASAAPQTDADGCCEEAVPQVAVPQKTVSQPMHIVPQWNCGCNHSLSDQPLISSATNYGLDFLPLGVALPIQTITFSHPENEPIIASIQREARPRGPDLDIGIGRAPPALALS